MIYTPEELAARWRVNLATVYRALRAGKIPCFKVGTMYRISEEQLIKYEKGE